MNYRKRSNLLMTRKKIIIAGSVYHITQRAPGREILFVEEGDYLRFIYLLKNTLKDFHIKLFCFSLLPNHLHLLLKIKKDNLDRAMKILFERYAKYFNTKYQRKGHVFSGVYRASYCNSDDYLLTASFYIHLNSYKAGITDSPFDYRWHSLDVYVRPIKKTFLDHKELLYLFSPELKKARKLYKVYIENLTAIKYSNIIENKSAIVDFHRRFTRWLRKLNIGKSKKEISSTLKSLLDIEEKIDYFRKNKVITITEKEAYLYLIEQLLSRGFSIREIASRLNRSRMAISKMIKKYNLPVYKTS